MRSGRGRTTASQEWLKRQLNDPYVAKAQARAMAESAYRPPVAPKAIPVAGSIGIAFAQYRVRKIVVRSPSASPVR